MTKDRLHELQILMLDGDNQNGWEDKTKEKSTLIEFFEHVSADTRATKLEIENLKNKVNDLKTVLNDNQQWASPETRNEMQYKIEKQKLVIANLASTIRTNLKTMKTTFMDSKGISVIQRIKNVQLTTIINELNEILRDYLQCLVQHREKLVRIFKDMLEVKGDKVSDIEALLEEGKIAIFTNNLLIGDMEEKYNLREAEDRHKGIMKIESSILEIKNLFNELALIVDLQGDKIEEVEVTVNENLSKIERGRDKLTSASKKKGKLRHRKLIVALICSGIILTVSVILIII